MDSSYDTSQTSFNLLNPSTIVLIFTAIYALLGFGFIIAAILISENKLKNINNSTGTSPSGSTGPVPSINPPSFTRISPKSISSSPLSTSHPSFPSKNHTVEKLSRTRALNDVISPNHWIGNTLYGTNSNFNVYPYHGRIIDDGFIFSWPTEGILIENCSGSSPTCPPGFSDLSFNVNNGYPIKIGSVDEIPLSCDILDIDSLITTVAWQYE